MSEKFEDSRESIIEDLAISAKLARYGIDPTKCGEDSPKQIKERVKKLYYKQMKGKAK